MILRTICYRAFCDHCQKIVSPRPRMNEDRAERDLAAHNATHHPHETEKSTT